MSPAREKTSREEILAAAAAQFRAYGRVVGGLIGQMAQRFARQLKALFVEAQAAGAIAPARAGLDAAEAAAIVAGFMHGLELSVGEEPARALRRRVSQAAQLFAAGLG